MEKFLAKVIEEYLENLDLDIDPKEIPSSEDIIDIIDPRELAGEIEKSLKDKILEFVSTPKLGQGREMVCGSCYRPHGVWRCNGSNLQENLVTAHGKRILLVDDI